MTTTTTAIRTKIGMPEDRVARGVGEARRQAGQRDLVAAGDQVVDAAEDAQRPERGDDRRDPEDRDDRRR